MIKFYLTETSLSNIVLSNSTDLQILMKQNTIYVNIEEETLDEYRKQYKEAGELNENNIILLLENDGDCQLEATTLTDEIVKNEAMLVQYPECVFVLNINSEDAKRLQDQYGILVISENNIDFSTLTESDFYACKKGKAGNWDEVLEVASKKPFNTIIINDRNLFTDLYKEGERTMHYGVDNIKSIIMALVASKKYTPECPIEVLLGFEGKKVNISKLNKELTDKLSDIVEKYKLVIELIGYDGRSSYWDFSHNRWMATNYATITLEHKFAAFRGNIAVVDQDVFYKPFYAEGLKSNNRSKHPITAHYNKIIRMADNIKDMTKNEDYYKYSIGFQVDVEKKVRNRILKEYLTTK